MKKVFAFIGSPLKEKSNTFTLTRMFIDELKKMGAEIDCEMYTAGHVNLRYCTGCWGCMRKGKCPMDVKDDMPKLKEGMLNADLVIFGSPVYTMSVSGQMKTFLDRLAAWYHTIRLAGKPAVSVATTAGGGLEEVHALQRMLLMGLGAVPIASLQTYGYFAGMLADADAATEAARKCAAEVYPYLVGEKKVSSTPEMEEAFQAMKAKSVGAREWLPADYEYWEKNGMLNIESFAELLQKYDSQ